MTPKLLPSTRDVREAFGDEIAALGGVVSDTHDGGGVLFMRAVFPVGQEVLPRDRFRGGVALRMRGEQILVHPYVLREVCKNGAIIALSGSTRRLERVDFAAPAEEIAEVLTEVREAVQTCGDDQIFSEIADQVTVAAERQAGVLLLNLPALARLSASATPAIHAQIVQRFEAERDQSLYGLMNSITSLARDTRDPDLRWELEELGGGVLAHTKSQPDPRRPAVALTV